MSDHSFDKTTASWWDQTVTITYGQIAQGVATWLLLDFVAALWRHL